jgi:predicted chitinase
MPGTRAAALIVALLGVFTLVQPATAAPFIVTEAQFNRMFPSRNSFYTYSGLKSAMGTFGSFANQGSDTVKKQELAAFLANVSHETGGLVYIK